MRAWILLGFALLLSLPFLPKATAGKDAEPSAASFTADGRMLFPANYREWTYLTSGIDMSYNPRIVAMAGGHSMFDNVFVNHEAYRAFMETGTWPDKTVMVLEIRKAESKGSINKSGHFQGTELMGVEVHVKDEARFPGKWAFFGFEGNAPAKQIPQQADCYSCHQQHGAVDTTFVQFYPTLLEVATKKSTLSAAYLKEVQSTAPAKEKGREQKAP